MFKSSIIAAVFTVGLLTSGAQAQDAKSVPDLKGSSKAQTHSPSISWSPVAPIREPVSPNTSESNDELSFDLSRNKTSLCYKKDSL
jgi:hypothetical protein